MSAYLDLPDGQMVPVRDGMVLGRVSGCDIVVDDTKASRKHARIVVQGSVAELEDLGSSNGTTLNGKPVQRRVLRDGDQIGIGATVLTFRAKAPAAHGSASVGSGSAATDDDVDLFGGDDAPAAPPPPVVDRPAPSQPAPARELPSADDDDDLAFDAPPVETRSPSARPGSPPAAAPPPSKSLVEFADEIVSVRSPAGGGAGSGAAARSGGVGGAGPDVQVKQRSLQFHKAEARGALGDDLSQLSGGMRLLVFAGVLAGMGGLAWLLMTLVS